MTKQEAIAKFRAVMKECLESDIVVVLVVANEGPVDEANVLHTLQTNVMASNFLGDVIRHLGRSDA